jgi:site-specific recombinase XerD
MILLPEINKAYLNYLEKNGQFSYLHKKNIMRVLSAFHDYLETSKVALSNIKIEDIDTFLIELNKRFSPATQKFYRLCLGKFIKYLYSECGILDRDISPLLENGPSLSQVIPPKFLRYYELQKLFNDVELSSLRDFRSYAILHLAYSLGLPPREICMITLDNIHFGRSEISLPYRRNINNFRLPLSEKTIKAIAIYIICARPQSKQRTLFLKHRSPYGPISPSNVCNDIRRIMRKANLDASTYWLRHTYAKNLLEIGASVFEIKEMLGHDRIRSSRRYLQINTEYIRQVLFDEKI